MKFTAYIYIIALLRLNSFDLVFLLMFFVSAIDIDTFFMHKLNRQLLYALLQFATIVFAIALVNFELTTAIDEFECTTYMDNFCMSFC